MAVITYDAVETVKNLITTKWSSIRPPRISAIWDKEQLVLVMIDQIN